MNTAQAIVDKLLEADDPHAKTEVTLQYRPFKVGDDRKWFWVLLPKDKSKALASGEATSRAGASTAARQSARKLSLTITKIDLIA